MLYPVYYNNNVYNLISGKSYDDITKTIVDTPTPTGRIFNLPLGQVSGRKGFGFRFGDMIVRGDGTITFNSDHIVMSGPAPRLYVYDVNRQKKWKNIEIIVEYMRVSENNPPSYAGLGIGVRSIHETQTSNNLTVPTYYFKHTFDGRMFFEKEWRHGSQYTKQPNSQDKSYPHPKNQWMRVKFTITNNDLKGYRWENSTWKLIRQYTDTGNWDGHSAINEGTSCFIRNDSVSDFRIRQFSIKELI